MKNTLAGQTRLAVALVAGLAGMFAEVHLACAQPLQLEVLASFNGTNGTEPNALTLGNDGSFYGTTLSGGTFNFGMVFRVTTNGVLTTLTSFDGTNGANPYAGLTLDSEGRLYGTTTRTVFRVATNGVLTTLAYTDGFYPNDLALSSDGNFYGTTEGDPIFGGSTVFRVTTAGVLTTLVSFNGTNGVAPYAGLTLGDDGSFYGTTAYGGSFNLGTVFRVTTNGMLTTLVLFDGTNGALPYAGLTLGGDGNFYGTTSDYYPGLGPSPFDATVFRMTTSGMLTTLASFQDYPEYPYARLTLCTDGNFYGTTVLGGTTGNGTIFQITTNGVLTTLVSFNGTNGAGPYGGLTLGSDGNFYGTTSEGGPGGVIGGVIFRLRRQVSIQSSGMASNGFQLNTLNVGGSGWVVLESSSDLMAWTPIQTNGTAAAQTFLDPAALTQPQQFYRVRQQ